MTQSSNSNTPDWTARTAELQMIQGVINRMASNSFQIKGGVIALLVLLLQKNPTHGSAIWVSFAPYLIVLIGGWVIDGYFLYLERSYRGLYIEVIDARNKNDFTNMFSLDLRLVKHHHSCLACAVFSKTLLWTYAVIVLFCISVIYISYCF
jgi:hypothetical protein